MKTTFKDKLSLLTTPICYNSACTCPNCGCSVASTCDKCEMCSKCCQCGEK